jgi:hypothetical protein
MGIEYDLPPSAAPQPNKYKRIVKGAEIEVYDVLKACNVTNPALQHLIKKALQSGNRGHKDLQTDLQDIIDSAVRTKELSQ